MAFKMSDLGTTLQQVELIHCYAPLLFFSQGPINVSYFDLFQNSVSMIAEIARSLPRASEEPEKILDQLFEPLLGKNVMR